jgi:hypothetical protein
MGTGSGVFMGSGVDALWEQERKALWGQEIEA